MKKTSFLVVLFLSLLWFFSYTSSKENFPNILVDNADFSISSPLSLWFAMYRMHMSLALSQHWFVDSSFAYANLVLQLQDVSSYDVLDLLAFETDKRSAMDSYIWLLDKYYLQSDIALFHLKDDLSYLDSSIKHCSSEKTLADKQYFDAVQFPYQQQFLENALADSKKYAQCVSDAKIEYNAKKILVDKIVAYQSLIKAKYTYLFANKDDIIEHYDLINTDILNRLTTIKRTLEKKAY